MNGECVNYTSECWRQASMPVDEEGTKIIVLCKRGRWDKCTLSLNLIVEGL